MQQAVGDYAGKQYKKYLDEGNTEEAAKWADGGIYRIALHAALGGLLTGDIAGAAAAGSVASAAPLLNNLQQAVTESLTQAGASTQAASTISQALAELTSLGIGSAIGGAAGAGASLVVDTNNRQLHPMEIELAKKLAKESNGKYTQKQIEDTLRTLGNSEFNESVVSGMLVDMDNWKQDIYDKGAQFIIGADGKTLVQILPTVSQDVINYVISKTGDTTSAYMPNIYILPSSIPEGDFNRDRMTGLPLDKNGRYSVSTVIDGKTYTAKYYSCATLDCMTTGTNIDNNDPDTKAYQHAMQQKGLSDLGKAAAVVSIVSPVGIIGAGAELTGGASSMLAAYLDNNVKGGVISQASQEGFGRYLEYVWGFSKSMVVRFNATVELIGGWDKIKNDVKAQDEQNKLHQVNNGK